MAPNPWFDDIQKNLSELLARTPAADMERTVKAFLSQAFSRMDLITREEFDIQADLLSQALEQLRVMEQRVAALEARWGPANAPGDPTAPVDDATPAPATAEPTDAPEAADPEAGSSTDHSK